MIYRFDMVIVEKQIEDHGTERGRQMTFDKVSNLLIDGTPYLLIAAPVPIPGEPDGVAEVAGICTAKTPKEVIEITMVLVELMDCEGPFKDIVTGAMTVRTLNILNKKKHENKNEKS